MADVMAPNKARFTVREVAQATAGKYVGLHEGELVGVTTDSRAVEKGNLFVAIKGDKFDGHKYQTQAFEAGAAAVLVQEEWTDFRSQCIFVDDTLMALGDLARYHRQRFDIPVVAVTGSYGKTSTRALIHAALSAGGGTLTSQANFNNEIGLPMTLFQLEKEHNYAVLEMGMRGLNQIDYLAKIALPTVGVITNIGPQHIELLGSLENLARAKAELIENLPADGLAVLPADSPFLPMLKGKAPRRFVTFGLARDADYRVENVRDHEIGIAFDLHFDGKVHRKIPLPMIGAHNAINAAAALAVAHQSGIEIADAERYLESAQLPGARMRVIQTETLTIIDDCYNAGPDSMRAALQTLRDFPSNGRRVAVLGAMRELGEFSDDEHRKLGELAGEICDFVVGVGAEMQPMMETLREQGQCQLLGWSLDATAATARVLAKLERGDVVLVKGSRSVGLEVVVEELKNKL